MIFLDLTFVSGPVYVCLKYEQRAKEGVWPSYFFNYPMAAASVWLTPPMLSLKFKGTGFEKGIPDDIVL